MVTKIRHLCQPDSIAAHRNHVYTIGYRAGDAMSGAGVLCRTLTAYWKVGTIRRLHSRGIDGIEGEEQIHPAGHEKNCSQHYLPQ